ncbi:hypothetical protein FEU66_21060 [Escherichia coli]|uniref:Uncharacterized protein n=1 Tax=Escherichia coli TaxID=562 RepID=A0A7L7E803_ECOLX|nr:hypothetical protein [Escherichia coli]EFD0882038.1 hypothetical protein [Escherichia coli]EGU0173259.1 hypothetical protein [Escherichia coli]ELJ9861663.1 hypothetical protein [Escherichia coli]MBA8435510.1 hypothetical protein [Escherichia coli]
MSIEDLPPEHRDDGLPAKVASLASLQTIIARMASNSQLMKTWAITIVTGFIAIKSTFGGLGCLSYLVPLLICISFSYLDSYYLSQERIFRDVYNKLAAIPVGNKVMYLDFKNEIFETSKKDKNSLMACFKSPSIIYFYFPMTIISTAILIKG